MYSPDFEMKAGVSDVYIYNKNGAEKEFVPLNNTIEDTENNVTWLQEQLMFRLIRLELLENQWQEQLHGMDRTEIGITLLTRKNQR